MCPITLKFYTEMIQMNLNMKLINNWKRKLNLWNQLLKLLIWAIMRIHT